MARLVTHTRTGPLKLRKKDIEDDVVWICQCGLTADWPRCDGSHARTRSEEDGKPYTYHRGTPDGPLVAQQKLPESLDEGNPRPAEHA